MEVNGIMDRSVSQKHPGLVLSAPVFRCRPLLSNVILGCLSFKILSLVPPQPNMFSIEDDLLTPTFKLKRPQLQKKYQAHIDAMYKELKE